MAVECPDCGAAVEPGDVYCSSCGRELADDAGDGGPRIEMKPEEGLLKTAFSEIGYDFKLLYYLWPTYLIVLLGVGIVFAAPRAVMRVVAVVGIPGYLGLVVLNAFAVNWVVYLKWLQPDSPSSGT